MRILGLFVLLVAVTTLFGCGRTYPTAGLPALRSGEVEVEGGRLFYEEAGAGVAVVLIHGGFGDRRMWDGLFEHLASDFRVVRYDHRGFGRSPAPDSAYSPADDLRRLLERLDTGRAHIVGNSMGGSLAIDFALLHPDLVRSLVVVASGPAGLDPPPEAIASVVAVFEAASAQGTEVAADMWLAHPMVRVTSRDTRTAPLLRAMVHDNAGAFLMPFGNWPGERLDPPASRRLDEIDAPTLVVVGSADTPFVRSSAAAAADGIRGAELLVLDGADHLPQMARPAAFEGALRGFLLEN
jgi:pimeloyl-ACP methyl ester carboxylesterase